ncbi:uncharacterized protein [Atheta coriaria]|uniref:uncharacterized protein isoform X2 n=1 Tax=Dalotia coriaria TaxID=877792 RepID=UPI0031F45673
MGRCCAVHGCFSGRKTSKKVEKVALFKAPKDVELCSKWSSALGQKLKATSYICELHFNSKDVIRSDQTILKDGSVYVHEFQKVHLRKEAAPKSNIISDSDESIADIDMVDHSINDDCNHNPVETDANTNFPDVASTVIEDDNLLVVNSTEEFSFRSIQNMLEAQPLRKNWCWTVIINSFISLSYISSKLELVCHVKIDVNLKVMIINAKTNIVIDMDVNISSFACVWQLLDSLENCFFCSGTGYDDKKCSDTCTGILLPGDRYKRIVLEYRCINCRKLRRLLQKRKTKTTNDEARRMNLKHRYKLQRRKLNRVVQTNKNLKRQLLQLKNHCAEIKEKVLSEKISYVAAL